MHAERLLGSLIGDVMGGSGGGIGRSLLGSSRRSPQRKLMRKATRGLTSGKGLITALGLAVGAYETLTADTGSSQQTPPPPPLPTSSPSASGPPPLPPVPRTPPDLPPIPTAPASAGTEAPMPPPPIPGQPVSGPDTEEVATRLIQAMIAAAHADGVLDDDERENILDKVAEAGLGEEERRFLVTEMENPRPIEDLVSGVTDPTARRLMYGLSVATIEMDTRVEFRYLQDLGKALGLTEEEMDELHEEFGDEDG